MRLSEYSDEELIEEVIHRGLELKVHVSSVEVIGNFSTKELIDELRTREGVETYDVPVEGQYQIQTYSSRRITNHNTQLIDEVDSGPAIIFRIID